jgi:hypothetical protein
MALWRLRSGQHDLQFHVGCDDDDPETVVAAELLADEPPVAVHVGKRPIARGETENRVLKHAREVNADVVTMLTDRTFPITPGWDIAIAQGATEAPKRVLWWSCPEDNVCVMPIIPKAWLEACDYHWSPEIFPFWFDDTWNQQIDLMLHGMPSMKVLTSYSGVRAATSRARDFEFWINLFRQTFPMRVAQARAMAPKLGVEWVMREDVVQYFDRHHNSLMANLPKLNEMFGDKRDPDETYTLARERADRLMQSLMAKEAAE